MKFESFASLRALALAAALTGSSAFAVPPGLADSRCGTWGDSLSQPEAQPRADFAVSCEQDRIVKSTIRRMLLVGMKNGESITAGYPTYGFFDEAKDEFNNPKGWFAPPRVKAACSDIPSGYRIAFFCASGCYTPDQKVLFLGGNEAIGAAKDQKLESIQALDPSSTLDHPKLTEAKVDHFISDYVAGPQEILTLVMKSGGKLRVTQNHPLVDGNGVMRRADTMRTGESLVKADGSQDAIESITKAVENTKVYNVAVDANVPRGHIVVAQGYLNGGLYFQNEGVKELNRILLRTSVAEHFIRN